MAPKGLSAVFHWISQSRNILRYQNLLKFFAWTAVSEEARAKELSEPEDPDYYGDPIWSLVFSMLVVTLLAFRACWAESFFLKS